MIKLELKKIEGWEPAIEGARNAMNSWDRMDSAFDENGRVMTDLATGRRIFLPILGPNDYKLAMNLAKQGGPHAKFRRMIVVWANITAPMYWWKEFDTYKVGTVRQSCSTMHKIHAKKFEQADFSCEHLGVFELDFLNETIKRLNVYRDNFNDPTISPEYKKQNWWNMIQRLPSSYNQKSTVLLNYEVLSTMYKYRKDHKLDEWRQFCEWIENLPYSELITYCEGDNGVK